MYIRNIWEQADEKNVLTGGVKGGQYRNMNNQEFFVFWTVHFHN